MVVMGVGFSRDSLAGADPQSAAPPVALQKPIRALQHSMRRAFEHSSVDRLARPMTARMNLACALTFGVFAQMGHNDRGSESHMPSVPVVGNRCQGLIASSFNAIGPIATSYK